MEKTSTLVQRNETMANNSNSSLEKNIQNTFPKEKRMKESSFENQKIECSLDDLIFGSFLDDTKQEVEQIKEDYNLCRFLSQEEDYNAVNWNFENSIIEKKEEKKPIDFNFDDFIDSFL